MNIAELAALQAEEEDYTKPTEAGVFDKVLPVAGACVLRFREYIELGLQKNATTAYPNKKPALKARFVFELTTPKHTFEVEDAEGNKSKYGHVIAITVAIGKDPKNNYFKLFKMLNYEGNAKVPAQLLGNAYKAMVYHNYDNKDMKDGKPIAGAMPKYANLHLDGVYSFEPPRIIDPLAETITPINVPEMLGDKKLFLWNHPTPECWSSIFVDGTFNKEVDGKEVVVSKNWLQNSILAALNYEGSKLQEMLVGAGDTLDDLPIAEKKKTTAKDIATSKEPAQKDQKVANNSLEALMGTDVPV